MLNPAALATEPMYVVHPIHITDKHAAAFMLGKPGCDKCAGYGNDECKTCNGNGETFCNEPCCGGHTCRACDGSGGGPCPCFADKTSGRAILAAEATRLWQRDVGRGITTGTPDVYIRFAVQALKESA